MNEITLLNQSTKQETKLTTSSQSITKFVRKGDYEIFVSSDAKNSLSINKVGGFLKKTTVDSQLKPQNHIDYTGYGAGACSFYNDVMAISWGCLSDARSLVIHRPSKNIQPSYNDSNPYKLEGTIEGIVHYKNETIALIRGVATYNGDQIYFKHYFYRLDKNYRPIEKISVKGLSPNKLYQVKSSSNKIVIYESKFENIYTFDSLNSKPTKIESEGSSDKEQLTPRDLVVNNNEIIILYTNYVSDIDKPEPDNALNRFYVISEGKKRTIDLDKRIIDQFNICNISYLCTIENSNLNVFKIDNDGLKYEYLVTGVDSMVTTKDSLLVSKKDGVINFSIVNKNGYYSFIATGTKPCGIRWVGSSDYLSCLYNDNVKALLRIDLSMQKNSDPIAIMKKLSDLDTVENVSIYKNNIIISPEFGNTLYVKDIGEYGYDPVFQKQTISSIKKSLESIGKSIKAYDVYIIGENL